MSTAFPVIGDFDLAAAGVFGTGTVWPDIAITAMLAFLGLSSGRAVIAQARAELQT